MQISESFLTAARALIASIADDTGPHGGLQSRETVRRADELRLAIDGYEKAKGNAGFEQKQG